MLLYEIGLAHEWGIQTSQPISHTWYHFFNISFSRTNLSSGCRLTLAQVKSPSPRVPPGGLHLHTRQIQTEKGIQNPPQALSICKVLPRLQLPTNLDGDECENHYQDALSRYGNYGTRHPP